MLGKGVPEAPPGMEEFGHLLAMLVEEEAGVGEWVEQVVPVRDVEGWRLRREVEEWECNRYAC